MNVKRLGWFITNLEKLLRKKGIIIFGILILFLFGVLLFIYVVRLPSPLCLHKVKFSAIEDIVSMNGMIHSKREILVMPPYDGYVEEIYVKQGDIVAKNTPLVKIARNLLLTEQVHPLRAPYAGVITIINRANGQFVQQAGSRGTDFVLKIEDLSELFIQADANDVDVVKLHTGQLASIKISAVPNKIFGVNSVFFHITNKTLQKGNFFRSILNRFSTGCVIGSGVAEQLFGEAGVTSSIGQIIKIGRDENTFTCKITGVLSEESSGNSDENLAIYLPYEYFIAVHTLPWLKSIHTFTVKLKNNNETIAVGKAIKKYFTSKYGNTGDFFVDANLILIHQMNEFITLSTLVLIATATLSLLVGGVGIVNMMLIRYNKGLKK